MIMINVITLKKIHLRDSISCVKDSKIEEKLQTKKLNNLQIIHLIECFLVLRATDLVI